MSKKLLFWFCKGVVQELGSFELTQIFILDLYCLIRIGQSDPRWNTQSFFNICTKADERSGSKLKIGVILGDKFGKEER